MMTNDAREATIKRARDSGANMVIAKPISPASLYDRLAWIAFNPRKFVDTATYFGPDRRFKIEGYRAAWAAARAIRSSRSPLRPVRRLHRTTSTVCSVQCGRDRINVKETESEIESTHIRSRYAFSTNGQAAGRLASGTGDRTGRKQN